MKKVQDCLTSELLFQALKEPNITEKQREAYLAEYTRRLKIMGLTDEQITAFREADEQAINNGCYFKPNVYMLSEPFIKAEMADNPIDLKKCTFSELIYLTDDANAAYSRDHGWLPDDTWYLVCEYSLHGSASAAWENRRRMRDLGLTEDQENIFVKNECQLAQRLRWHYSNDPAWVEPNK